MQTEKLNLLGKPIVKLNVMPEEMLQFAFATGSSALSSQFNEKVMIAVLIRALVSCKRH